MLLWNPATLVLVEGEVQENNGEQGEYQHSSETVRDFVDCLQSPRDQQHEDYTPVPSYYTLPMSKSWGRSSELADGEDESGIEPLLHVEEPHHLRLHSRRVFGSGLSHRTELETGKAVLPVQPLKPKFVSRVTGSK